MANHLVTQADDSNREIEKRNAADQAAALNQDPGGADRNKLLDELSRRPIDAGRAEVRSAHPDAQWFAKGPIGLFLHWGISGVHGDIDISWAMIRNMGTSTKIPPREYWALAERFKAEHFDPGKWCRAAKDAGFDYVVLTAKHHDGYTHWPTDTTDLGVRTKLPGHDHIRDYVAACRESGLKVGLYFSGPDWWQDREVRSFNYRSEGPGGSNSSLPPIPGRKALDIGWHEADLAGPSPELREQIRRNNHQQLVELLSKYGTIDLLWFDGGSGSDITLEEIRSLQPGIVINNRGGLKSNALGEPWPGDYFTFEHSDPHEPPPGWWEQLRIWNSPHWGYCKANETSYVSTASILATLAKTKAWGGALLVNAAPRPDGTMPPPFYAGMQEFAEWMETNRESVDDVLPAPSDVRSNVPITIKGEHWYIHALPEAKGQVKIEFGSHWCVTGPATVLGSSEQIPFALEPGRIRLTVPKADMKHPHEVIVLRVVSQ